MCLSIYPLEIENNIQVSQIIKTEQVIIIFNHNTYFFVQSGWKLKTVCVQLTSVHSDVGNLI